MDRRSFLKLASLAAGSFFVGGLSRLSSVLSQEYVWQTPKTPEYWKTPPPRSGVRYGMVIDARACIGCRKCVYACVMENNIGRKSGLEYIRILEMKHGEINLIDDEHYFEKSPDPNFWYLPAQCNHCEKPICVDSCPVKATWKEPDGIVIVDYNKCIGCRNCMVNCPYWQRKFNWVKPEVPEEDINPKVPIRPVGVVEKCTFCIHRVREGKEPRCVEACPLRVRKFGDLNDPDSVVSTLLRTRRTFRLKEDLGTEPRVFYLG